MSYLVQDASPSQLFFHMRKLSFSVARVQAYSVNLQVVKLG